LLYLTGHGGDKFIKFQDAEEVTSRELAQAFAHMNSLNRYNEILFVSDTCQAFTLADEIHADNVISIGSSLRGENSYGHHVDQNYGVAVIDSFTYAFHSFTRTVPSWQKRSIKDWIDTATFAKLNSHVGFTDTTSQRKINTIPMADFFTMKANNPHASTAGDLVKPRCIKDDSLPNFMEDFHFSSTQDINGSAECKSNIIDDSFHVAAYQILNDMLSLSDTTQQNTLLSSRTFTPEFLVHHYSAFTANIWTVYIVYGLVIFVTTILFIVAFLATVGEDVLYTNENNYEGQLHRD
jgi:glycosylphosphatidylinositol transamidase (GPIT) subunit GPI8